MVIENRYRIGKLLGGDVTSELYAASHVQYGWEYVARIARQPIGVDDAADQRFRAAARQITAVHDARVQGEDLAVADDRRMCFVMTVAADVTIEELVAIFAGSVSPTA
jgi:hypothetical protein